MAVETPTAEAEEVPAAPGEAVPMEAATAERGQTMERTPEKPAAGSWQTSAPKRQHVTELRGEKRDVREPPGLERQTAAPSPASPVTPAERKKARTVVEDAMQSALASGAGSSDITMIETLEAHIDDGDDQMAQSADVPLDPNEIEAARADEMKRLAHFDVYDEVAETEAVGKVIDAKWVDRQKGKGVRSRIVARQFATTPQADLFAGTPDVTMLRAVLSNLASDRRKVLLIADVTSAYYQAPADTVEFVRPPPDVRKPGKLWRTKKAMPGLRSSAVSWQDHYAHLMEDEFGQTRSLIDSCGFADHTREIVSAIWGDDLIASGWRSDMADMGDNLHEHLECNVCQLVGADPDLGKEARFTKRVIRCVPGTGWEYEADVEHVKRLIAWYGCEDARGGATPGTKDMRKPTADELDADGNVVKLSAAGKAEYCTTVGLMQYISNDRYDIKFAVKELKRDAAEPTEVNQRMAKRLVRYLRAVPRYITVFRWAPRAGALIVTVDADHAGDEQTRKSTSSGLVELNGHVLADWSTTQATISLSSGESEFIAIIKGITTGLFVRKLLTELGWTITELVVRSDSSAARGMLSRLGVGRRCKHLETKSLFAQHLVKEKAVRVITVGTAETRRTWEPSTWTQGPSRGSSACWRSGC